MDDKGRLLAKAVRASQRVAAAEAKLDEARDAYYIACRDAIAGGVTISALARALGVTRQAIHKAIRRRD